MRHVDNKDLQILRLIDEGTAAQTGVAFFREFVRRLASALDSRYAFASRRAHQLGVGVNAGHDLDLRNLTLFRTLPHLDEVSIGHALISRALFVGLGRVVKEYLAVLAG